MHDLIVVNNQVVCLLNEFFKKKLFYDYNYNIDYYSFDFENSQNYILNITSGFGNFAKLYKDYQCKFKNSIKNYNSYHGLLLREQLTNIFFYDFKDVFLTASALNNQIIFVKDKKFVKKWRAFFERLNKLFNQIKELLKVTKWSDYVLI